MAGRKRKTGADWFSHDSNARNSRKIKALENKFGLEGYAVFFKTLEMLAEAEGTRVEFNESEIVLVAGDFGLDPGKLGDIWTYCILLGLLQKNDLYLFSLGLKERLEPMFAKRERDRSRQASNYRSENKNKGCNSSGDNGDSSSENDTKESKAKESKAKERKSEEEEENTNTDELGKIQSDLLKKILDKNSERVALWRQKAKAAGVDMESIQIAFVNKAIREDFSFERQALQAGFDGYLNSTVKNKKQKQNEKNNGANRSPGPSGLSKPIRRKKDTSAAKEEGRYKSGW